MAAALKDALGRPYQIYTESVDCGKNLQGSKKRIKWRFGWAAEDDEHDILMVHSLVSGKKVIFEDGEEIASSSNFFEFNFGHSWKSRKADGHIFRIDANLPPFGESYYIFSIDGKRFIDLPRKQPEKRASDAVNKLSNVDIAVNDDEDAYASERRGKKKVTGGKEKQRAASSNNSRSSSNSVKSTESSAISTLGQSDNRIKKNQSSNNNNKHNNSNNSAADRGFFQSPVPTSNSVFDPFDQPSGDGVRSCEVDSRDLFDDFVNTGSSAAIAATASTNSSSGNGKGGGSAATIDLLDMDSLAGKAQAAPGASQADSVFAGMKAPEPSAPAPVLIKENSRYAMSDPFAAPIKSASREPAAAAADPFAVPSKSASREPAAAAADPFAVPIKSASREPAAAADPFAVPIKSASREPAAAADPFAVPIKSASREPAAAAADPFAVPSKSASREPAAAADPFAAPSKSAAAKAKGSPFEDPFAVPIKGRPATAAAKKTSIDSIDPFKI